MKKIKMNLENCYGIKKLNTEIPFSAQKAVTIYAPNGAMKSSLAQTFFDLSKGKPSRDRFFPMRKPLRKITDEKDTDLSPEMVFVVTPYDKDFAHTEKTSTLLVNNTLKKEYTQITLDVEKEKSLFIRQLKELSGCRKDIEKEISTTFTKTDNEFYVALGRVKEEMAKQKEAPFSNVPYDIIFDDKVLDFLKAPEVRSAIKEYVEKYNDLLDKSTYFKRGFNYYNAATIAKNLADHGFFDAKHTVTLVAREPRIIKDRAQLEKIIDDEKNQILSDSELKTRYLKIEKLIHKNEDVREFNNFISGNEDLVPFLENLDKFKEEIWKSYFKTKIDSYNVLIEKYEKVELRKAQIEEEARKEITLWETAIAKFNDRFDVPFTLEAKNKTAVMLEKERLLTLSFTFVDGDEKAPVRKEELLEGLSTGEKKALYILNIVFEVEQRKKLGQKTLFVIDDVADSFDYKNKYAIIEYLIEISRMPNFYQIILTHNFDFFRTINSRYIDYPSCFMAVKTKNGIQIKHAEGIRNVFLNDWKKYFYTNAKKRIASIPFMRNLMEMLKGEEDPTYLKLTSLLHWRSETPNITQGELAQIFKQMFGIDGAVDKDKKVIDLLREEVDGCLLASDGINFENKIVLSIAIRIMAEKFMIEKINDPQLISSTSEKDGKRTSRLFDRYKDKFPPPSSEVDTIERVILMTPETIHLNSFMYEPILDMSDWHLKDLYKDVRDLK